MRSGETFVEMERRHVRQAESHVTKQRALVARLRSHELPSELAEQLLADFERSLHDHRTSLARVLEERRRGLRDDKGEWIAWR